MRVGLFLAFCLLLPSLEASPRRFCDAKTDLFDVLSDDQPGGVVDLVGVVDPVPALVQAGVVLGDGSHHRPPPHRQDGLAKDHHPRTRDRPWAPHLPTPGRL